VTTRPLFPELPHTVRPHDTQKPVYVSAGPEKPQVFDGFANVRPRHVAPKKDQEHSVVARRRGTLERSGSGGKRLWPWGATEASLLRPSGWRGPAGTQRKECKVALYILRKQVSDM
jgi:hypothetical protein